MFGDVNLRSDLKCAEISNIDFVPANIILSDDKVSVIDYEWTFAFPVPSQYLVYRMIFYYLELNDKRRVLRNLNFYEKAGITPEDIEIYVEMEHNLQAYILGKHTACGICILRFLREEQRLRITTESRRRKLWRIFRFSGITERVLMRQIL